MPIHDQVLAVALRLCRERGGWTFGPEEVVRALPHLNAQSVRTHVVSRCCVNAPRNHPHRWGYFRRVARGRYEIVPQFRRQPSGSSRTAGDARRVAEPAIRYGTVRSPVRDTIHAVLVRSEGVYVAECLEVSVITQGRTADEVISNLQEAIALHLEGEDLESLGLSGTPRLVLTYEMPVAPHAARV
jgi:predicted RNase H-like HicB family nuclease